MKQPEPFSAFERQLLESGRNEALPSALKQRMASALEPPTLATAAAVSGIRPALKLAAGAGRLKLVAAWVGAGALAASLAGWYALSRPAPAKPAQPMPATATPQPTAAVPAPAAPAPAPAAQPEPTTASSFAEEIALLDRARGALRAGAPERASRVLVQYRRRFAQGVLAPEADVLQIEALSASGSSAQAQRLAKQFLAKHPQHPGAARIQQLVPASGQ